MTAEGLNYYEILEVSKDAKQDKIFEAYQKARQTFSLKNPDIYKVFEPAEAQAWVRLIEEAYQVIGYEGSRQAYDSRYFLQTSSGVKQATSVRVPVKKTLTDGYAETPMSQYKVQKSMEDAIKKQDHFDGIFLKKIREYKNIDLNDLSRMTCIAIRHLYAIENNNFSVLPAPVFVRGYIIQYCRMLTLDQDKVVPSFMSLLNDEQ